MQCFCRFVCQLFGFTVLSSLFASYPVALIPPGMEGASYYIRLPSLFILTLISILIVLTSHLKLSRHHAVLGLVFVTIVGGHIVQDFSHSKATIEFLGYLIIPLAFCLYLRVSGTTTMTITSVASLLWLLSVVYGFMNHYQGREVIGITGNRNWMAITLLSLSPWAIWRIFQGLSKWISSVNLRLITSVSSVSIPTLILIFYCRSRAAWLALGVYSVGFLLSRLRNPVRNYVVVGVLAITALTIGSRPDRAVQAYVQDIRGPTWLSTIQLIADHPFLGVGPGNYTREYAKYRANSDYHRRKDLADLTTHPHNEFLNIAANIGLIAAISWIILIIPIVSGCREKALTVRLAQFSAFVIYFHSFLDKPLVQPPSSIIGLCCLGIVWQPFIDSHRAEYSGWKKQMNNLLFIGYLMFAIAWGLRVTGAELGVGWHRREAVISRNHGEFHRAYSHYRRVTELDVENIRGYYGAGAIALQNLHDPRLSIENLNQVVRLNPRFAHVNSLLGKAYGTIGDHAEARRYFEKECKLFPSDIPAFHNFFASSAQVGDFQRLPRIEEYLNKLYLEKIQFRNQPDNDLRLVASWMKSVADNDFAAAADSARRLFQSVDHVFLDPLFYNLKRYSEWPTELAHSDFNSTDGGYWENVIWRHDLIAEFHAGTDSTLDSGDNVELLFRRLSRDFDIDSSENVFRLPKDAWAQKRGSSLTFCALLAWINRYNGAQTLICPVADEKGEYFPVVINGDSWLLFNLKARSVSRIDIAGDIRNVDVSNLNISKDVLVSALTKSKLFFFPGEFFLKNHALAVIVDAYRVGDQLAFDRMPILEAVTVRGRLLEQAIDYNILEAYLPAPIDLFLAPADSR